MSEVSSRVMWEVHGVLTDLNGKAIHSHVLCVCAKEADAIAVVNRLEACTVDGCVLIGGHVNQFNEYVVLEICSGSAIEIAVASAEDLARDPLLF